MDSHHYKEKWQQGLRVIPRVLGLLVLFSLVLHVGKWLGWWPRPCPATTFDAVVLSHQALATEEGPSAERLLLGDSSCMMDVDPVRLGNALNIGTLSYLGIDAFAEMLTQYRQHHAGWRGTVILLLHPEALRRKGSVPAVKRQLDDFYARRDAKGRGGYGRLIELLGYPVLRDRILSRHFPWPLGKRGGDYGYTRELWQSMTRERGGVVASGQFKPGPGQGNAEYRLDPALEQACREFRQAALHCPLLVGITPAPESFVLATHQDCNVQMANELGQWLQAEKVLQLPAAMPDLFFADTRHLNEEGRRVYTDLLKRQIRIDL